MILRKMPNWMTLPRTRGGISRQHNQSIDHTKLFPAHAGVFPKRTFFGPSAGSLPRTRGGISGNLPHSFHANLSSPHTRGYFRLGNRLRVHIGLFPAHAGVFPVKLSSLSSKGALPRTRGGISTGITPSTVTLPSSPHTRGYFLHSKRRTRPRRLFPAHAGVFPPSPELYPHEYPLPRTRGGISASKRWKQITDSSSPHTRGYFHTTSAVKRFGLLFPAHAGVFP